MSVTFTIPPSRALPTSRADSVVWARHRLLGGKLARAWGSYDLDGETWVWTIRHGSGCDPTADVDALTGANLATIVLTPGTDYTSQDVADAIAAGLASDFGHDATVDSTTVDGQTRYTVTVAGATAGAVGPTADDSGVSGTCGTQQGRRDGAGSVNATLWIHTEVHARNRDGSQVADGTRARIIGVGYYGTGGFRPRLAVGTGGPYGNPPGLISQIQDAGRPGVGQGSSNGYEPIVLPLPTAIPCAIGDDAWIAVTDNASGGSLGYRLHSSSGLFGDLSNSELMLVEGGRNTPGSALPSSVTPTITASFTVCSTVFLVVEVDDENAGGGVGFCGDGSIAIEYGCQRDAAGETPSTAVPFALGDGEVLGYRFRVPPLDRVAITALAYGLAVVDPDEDASAAVYEWPDLANPPGSTVSLVGTTGLLGWNTGAANAYHLTEITPIAIGDDVVSQPYLSVHFGFGVVSPPGIPTTMQVLFDALAGTFGPDGERVYDQGQSPDLQPSDWVVGGLRDASEFASLPTSTMPYDGPTGSWPSTYDLGGLDALPGNLGRFYFVLRDESPTADVVSVETTADGTSATVDLGLSLAASARAVVPASSSPAIGLDLASAAATLRLHATWQASIGLRMILPSGLRMPPPEITTGATPMPAQIPAAIVDATPYAVEESSGETAVRLGPAAADGQRVVALGGFLKVSDATTLQVYDGDPDDGGTAISGQLEMAAGEVLYLGPHFRSSPGQSLWLARTGASRVDGTIDAATTRAH